MMIPSWKLSHLRCASLFLFLLFPGNFTCGWHKGAWLNRPRRDLQEAHFNNQTVDDPNVTNEVNIKAALYHLREVLLEESAEIKTIDPKVIEFFANPDDYESSFPVPNKTIPRWILPFRGNCREVVRIEIPQPIENLSDQSHFLINISDFQQTVMARKCYRQIRGCRPPKYKNVKYYCTQLTRGVKVLVLPRTKQSFNVRDFKIDTYHVNNNCICSTLDNLYHFY